MELFIVSVKSKIAEEMTLRFTSKKELNKYKKNPYVKEIKILEHYTNLNLEEFDALWG